MTITRFFARPCLISTGCEISPTLATNNERKVWMKASEKKLVMNLPSRLTISVQVQSRMNPPNIARQVELGNVADEEVADAGPKAGPAEIGWQPPRVGAPVVDQETARIAGELRYPMKRHYGGNGNEGRHDRQQP